MDRRYALPTRTLHTTTSTNNPYLTATTGNPYLSSGISRYSKQLGTTRSNSSWILWDPQTVPSHNPWCSLLTILILFLVILGVLAVAGLALYMGALRLEPTQSYLIFDGSMRVTGDRYNNNLANKSTHFFTEKTRKYQTLLEAAYSQSLLGPSLHQLFITSFANGSLIVFFRIILDRRKIPKPITSIEDILKTVIIQEASSPLSIMNTLKIDPKEILIKRFVEDPKYTSKEDFPLRFMPEQSYQDNSTKVTSLERKTIDKSDVANLNGSLLDLSTSSTSENAIIKTLPSQMIQGSYLVTSGDKLKTKKVIGREDDALSTPSLILPSTKRTINGTSKITTTTEKPTTELHINKGSMLLSMKHSPVLKQYLQLSKNSSSTSKYQPVIKIDQNDAITNPMPTITGAHYSDEPWKPVIPETSQSKRNFNERIDFDYGIGEAEVVLDNYSDVNVTIGENVARMKTRPVPIENQPNITQTPIETQKNDTSTVRPKIIFRTDLVNEQKSMPELSILKQFHDLDSLLRTQTTAKPNLMEDKRTTVVTLLPVRSNVGLRPNLRPRPKDELPVIPESTNVKADLSVLNPTQASATEGNLSTGTAINISAESIQTGRLPYQEAEMVAIPLQKYFTTTIPAFIKNKETQTPFMHNNTSDKISAYVTENLKDIAVITTDKMDTPEHRYLWQSINHSNNTYINRKPKMPNLNTTTQESGTLERFLKQRPIDDDMKLLLEEIFFNLTTTARTVSRRNKSRTDLKKTTNLPLQINFNLSPTLFNSTPKSPFNMNTTQYILNKLAKLQIASSETINNNSHYTKEDKVSNKAVATSFPGNGGGFRILTKIFNKIPPEEDKKTQTPIEISTFETPECVQNDSILCGSGECIPAHLRCNKLWDCHDGTDETNCTCADFLKNQFHTRKICDGIFDCWDYSDEQECDWCSPGQYVCGNSRMCIDQSQICDGFPHCPYGDDEKNCITLAPSLEMANDKNYHSSGYLMVRKEGEWGKMCMQNFDNVISKSKTDWSIDDLGQSVCKSLTYRNFDNITKQKDANARSVANTPVYYELSYNGDNNDTFNNRRSSREKFSFQKTTCIEKEVAQVACSDLECGIRPEATIPWANERRSRIVGGGNAGPGSWPWQAALYKEGEFQCGATLISDKWLLSAGHCFYHAQDDYWVARLGALRRGTPPAPHEQLRPISSIVLHPEYEDAGFVNDISLLRLYEPVVLSSFVRPICLPQPTQILKDGTMCTVVGWGQLFEIGRVFPDTLQEVQLPIISTGECRKRTLFLPLYKVTDNMFCAGYERGGRDACLGDSGGPLMCQESDGRWALTGVTSNGYGCARANRPGVYTKVINYLDWVNDVMQRDEQSYGPPPCHGHRCPLGECLPPARLCNGYIECRDSSDEWGCT